MELEFTLNGRAQRLEIEPQVVLADLLRDRLMLTGVKVACARAVCGSCTVLVDGTPTASCATFAFLVEGREVETIEGLQPRGGPLHPIQQAFQEQAAFQCGYCTAGMIMLTKALLAEHPRPSREEIVSWISSNICRCTGYGLIIAAVERAAELTAAAK